MRHKKQNAFLSSEKKVTPFLLLRFGFFLPKFSEWNLRYCMTPDNPEQTARNAEKFTLVLGLNLILYIIPFVMFFSRENIMKIIDWGFFLGVQILFNFSAFLYLIAQKKFYAHFLISFLLLLLIGIPSCLIGFIKMY